MSPKPQQNTLKFLRNVATRLRQRKDVCPEWIALKLPARIAALLQELGPTMPPNTLRVVTIGDGPFGPGNIRYSDRNRQHEAPVAGFSPTCRCVYCESWDTGVRATLPQERVRYHKCRACGVVFKSEMLDYADFEPPCEASDATGAEAVVDHRHASPTPSRGKISGSSGASNP